jgi:AcrR family transcriptional regulator
VTSTHKGTREDARRNREAVIDASLELLSEQPTATMSAIAELSGLGRTTLYRHFASRDELVRALFERVVGEAREATLEVISRDAPLADILCDLGPAVIGIGRRFQFLEGLRRSGGGDEVLEESTLDPNDPLRAYLTEAQERGEVPAEMPIQWILSAISGLAMATMAEVIAGRMDADDAGQLLGEVFARSFAPERGNASR